MWVLVAEGSGGNPSRDFFLFEGQHEIGRSQTKPDGSTAQGWISFPTLDKSISRNHAVVTVKKIRDVSDINQVPEITIRDKSKYGVSIDDVDDKYCRSQGGGGTQSERKIRKDEDIPLRQGCSITIGVNNSRLRLERRELTVSHSLLDKPTARKVSECCSRLGAHLLSQWKDSTTYLVMKELQLTPKMLLALIDQRDIVTPDFLTACLERTHLSDPFPPPGAFVEELPPEWEEGPLQEGGAWTWRNINTNEIVNQRPQAIRRYLFAPPFAKELPPEYLPHLAPGGTRLGNPDHKLQRQCLFQGLRFILLSEQTQVATLVKLNQQIVEHAKGRVLYYKPSNVMAGLVGEAHSCLLLVPDTFEAGNADCEAALRLLAAGAHGVSWGVIYRAVIEADVAAPLPPSLRPPTADTTDPSPSSSSSSSLSRTVTPPLHNSVNPSWRCTSSARLGASAHQRIKALAHQRRP